MRYTVSVNNKEHQVTLLNRSANNLVFEVSGESYSVNITPVFDIATNSSSSAPSVLAPPLVSAKPRSHPGEVTAPMPGVIVSLAVKNGQTVTLGSPLLVMEAMKMENSITSPRAGTIKKIHVKPGQQVENSQLLITIGE